MYFKASVIYLFINLMIYSYRNWYSPSVLEPKCDNNSSEKYDIPIKARTPDDNPEEGDPYLGHWAEYYNHHEYTSLDQLFVYNMNGTLKYRPPKLSMYLRNPEREYVYNYII